MTAPELYVCDAAEARDLTEQIKTSVERVYLLLLRAHEGKAYTALGYRTWGDYVRAEFDMGRQHSYRMLDQGRVIREITAAAGVSPMGDISERDARDLKPHLAEVTEQIREAVAVVPEVDRPAAAAAAVKAARETYRPRPTVAKVTETTKVETHVDTDTGEVLPVEEWATPHEKALLAQQPDPPVNPLAAARAEVARQPAVVAGKAIERLNLARKTFEAAGTPAEIVDDLAAGPIDHTASWIYEIDASLAVLNDLAALLRRRNLRSIR